jgi:carbonic anhydrase
MAKDIIDYIRKQQTELPLLRDAVPQPHEPEMLLIGCVDARLNIMSDIGIPSGKAIVFRDIAALVAGTHGDDDPEHLSEAAVLEFAINVMKVKHVVVMGHTDCGGIRSCLEDSDDKNIAHIKKYLAPLAEVREQVIAQGGDQQTQARAMEQAAVRQSVTNLRTYEVVQKAEKAGKIKLHGWVVNTATKLISEMTPETGEFQGGVHG